MNSTVVKKCVFYFNYVGQKFGNQHQKVFFFFVKLGNYIMIKRVQSIIAAMPL